MNSNKEPEVQRREDGSNVIPTIELLKCAFFSILGLWLTWKFLSEERALFSLSKHSRTYIEVSGRYSSFLGALSMLMLASASLSVIADHFDRRANEHKYKRFLKLSGVGISLLFALSIFVGWEFEHIQVVSK